jgi:hypothetical protein
VEHADAALAAMAMAMRASVTVSIALDSSGVRSEMPATGGPWCRPPTG